MSERINTTIETFCDGDGRVLERRVVEAPVAESSVEITTDAKGQPKPTVKVYHQDPAEALRLAVALYREARALLEVA